MTTPIPTQLITALTVRLATITVANGYHTTISTIRTGSTATEPQTGDTFPILNLFSISDEPTAQTYQYRRTLQIEALAATTTDLDELLDDLRRALLQFPETRWLSDTLSAEDPEIGAATFEPHDPGSDYHALFLTVYLNYDYHPE